MKTKLFSLTFVIIIAISSAIYFYSCKKSGTQAATAAASDYAGSWKVSEKCPSSTTYTMTITASGSSLTIKNLFNNCFTATGSFSGNSFTIPSQIMNASTSVCGYPYTVSGSGTISGTPFNSLAFSYSVKDGSGNTSSCTSTATK